MNFITKTGATSSGRIEGPEIHGLDQGRLAICPGIYRVGVTDLVMDGVALCLLRRSTEALPIEPGSWRRWGEPVRCRQRGFTRAGARL